MINNYIRTSVVQSTHERRATGAGIIIKAQDTNNHPSLTIDSIQATANYKGNNVVTKEREETWYLRQALTRRKYYAREKEIETPISNHQ
jgi:hypothetical protein